MEGTGGSTSGAGGVVVVSSGQKSRSGLRSAFVFGETTGDSMACCSFSTGIWGSSWCSEGSERICIPSDISDPSDCSPGGSINVMPLSPRVSFFMSRLESIKNDGFAAVSDSVSNSLGSSGLSA